eukprot:6676481-Alexandrium_andersonii.AAC.1
MPTRWQSRLGAFGTRSAVHFASDSQREHLQKSGPWCPFSLMGSRFSAVPPHSCTPFSPPLPS